MVYDAGGASNHSICRQLDMVTTECAKGKRGGEKLVNKQEQEIKRITRRYCWDWGRRSCFQKIEQFPTNPCIFVRNQITWKTEGCNKHCVTLYINLGIGCYSQTCSPFWLRTLIDFLAFNGDRCQGARKNVADRGNISYSAESVALYTTQQTMYYSTHITEIF